MKKIIMYNIADFQISTEEIKKNKERIRREGNESLGYLGTSIGLTGGLGIYDRIKKGDVIKRSTRKARNFETTNAEDLESIYKQNRLLKKAANSDLISSLNKGAVLGGSLALGNWINDVVANQPGMEEKDKKDQVKRFGSTINVIGVGSVLGSMMLEKKSFNPLKGFKNRNKGFEVENPGFGAYKKQKERERKSAEDFFNRERKRQQNNRRQNYQKSDNNLPFNEIPSIQKKFNSNDVNEEIQALQDIQRRAVQRVKNRQSKNKKQDIRLSNLAEGSKNQLTFENQRFKNSQNQKRKELYNSDNYKELKDIVEKGEFKRIYFLTDF